MPAAIRQALISEVVMEPDDSKMKFAAGSNREAVIITFHTRAGITPSADKNERRDAAFTPTGAAPSTSPQSGAGRRLSGYAAVFNDWTTIHDYDGSFREQVAPGAFKRTLMQRMPVLQFEHGKHASIGTMPLGKFAAIREDRRGLYVEADLLNNWMIDPVRDALAAGALNGMSFRFSVDADKWSRGADGIDERTLLAVTLYEAGVVSMPAYPTTSVTVA